MATLSFRHLDKIYDNNVQAVFDFNLEVKDKEFIVFVGPSGCGKSTTLRMIAGLEEISAGELYIDDVLVNDIEPKDRDIAMVFQSYALYPHMTVFDNMAYALKLRHVDKEEIRKRVNAAAEILGLTPYLSRKPKALSGGQRQRVALGRSIVRSPKVFLMDEPLSNLDAKLRVQMRNEITKIHQRVGATTIYVTHDQTEAMTMADRIVIMKDGKIQQIGTPRDVYDKPANLFVAGFIGSPAMNTFEVNFNGQALAFKESETVLPLTEAQVESFKEYAKNQIPKMDAETAETNEAIEQVNAEIAKLGTSRLHKKLVDAYQSQLTTLKEELVNLARRKAAYEKGEFPVIVGIRPDDVYLKEEANLANPSEAFSIEADIVELLGSESIIYASFAGHDLTSKTKATSKVQPHEKRDYVFDMDKLHFFDKESGVRVF